MEVKYDFSYTLVVPSSQARRGTPQLFLASCAMPCFTAGSLTRARASQADRTIPTVRGKFVDMLLTPVSVAKVWRC